jgi:hypothetical protein
MARARPISELDLRAPTGRNARIILRERLADMYVYARYVADPTCIQELHDLRIAVKRVRYTLEVFEEYLPEASKDFAEELGRLQDELGALHDSEVMLALLRLLLHQEQGEITGQDSSSSGKKKALLPPDMVKSFLNTTHVAVLSEKEQAGLQSFLHRQEQRREQAYTSFHRHWEKLEQRNFRERLLAMLESK